MEEEYQISLSKTIRKRQMKFLGHICRKDGLEKQVLCGKIGGMRGKGRQRNTFINSLNNYATDGMIRNAELIGKTEDREVWRSMVVEVCSRPIELNKNYIVQCPDLTLEEEEYPDLSECIKPCCL